MRSLSGVAISILSILGQQNVIAFAPSSTITGSLANSARSASFLLNAAPDQFSEGQNSFLPEGIVKEDKDISPLISSSFLAAPLLAFADPANAASAAPDAIPSALFAYGHYLSLFAIVACVTAERLVVKPNMTVEEEKAFGAYDIGLGLFGTTLLVSGYYRAVEYGKGWDFYSHEPVFWLKMAGVGVFGGLSLFNTIITIKRNVAIQQGNELEPMSEKLASRTKSILNAELSALALIPLSATFMSRGVGYVNDFPTQIVGPVGFGVVTAAAVFKYVKEALDWEE